MVVSAARWASLVTGEGEMDDAVGVSSSGRDDVEVGQGSPDDLGAALLARRRVQPRAVHLRD